MFIWLWSRFLDVLEWVSLNILSIQVGPLSLGNWLVSILILAVAIVVIISLKPSFRVNDNSKGDK